MQRIMPLGQSLPLFGIERTRAIEERASAVLPAHELMQRAGARVASLALAIAPHARTVWVAAGPGNNGGDGLAAAVHLQATEKQVRISLLGDPNRLPADARDAFERARAAGIAITDTAEVPALEAQDIAIDALLGIGASRAPEGALGDAVSRLNAAACAVLAVDVPSGLSAATGQPMGKNVVRASHTLTLLTLKPGLFTAAGRDHAGQVWLDDLLVGPPGEAPDAWLTGADIAAMEHRAHVQHKGSFGDVAIVGGARGMGGAAILAARAASGAGAGRVYVDMLDSHAPAFDVLHPELMFRRDWWKSPPEILGSSTVVCGCGGGDAVRAPLPRLLSRAHRLVLDADALNALAGDTALQTLLQARSARDASTVITPHPLEAARLLGCDAADVQADRIAAAQALADRFGCAVVLKGSGTVIAAKGVTPRVNSSGNASLATAGTGDVLAGWLGGLWSQRRAANAPSDAACIAAGAAYLHGAAADEAGVAVLPASALIERLRARR